MGSVLDTILAAGLKVQIADGENLMVWPKTAITPEIRAFIRAHKTEILDALTDDRRHCSTCQNLDGKRCRARNVLVIDWPPRRCFDYRPMADDPDQRTGRVRWPSMKSEV